MKQLLSIALMTSLAAPLCAQTTVAVTAEPDDAREVVESAPALEVLNAAELTLEEFRWLKRPVIVFADTPADPRFQEQMELLLDRPEELLERDIVVIVDTEPRPRSAIRKELRPRGFMLTLIGKDGRVNLRKPFPWDVREITRAIDKWPLRKQEIREGKAQFSE